MDQTPLLGIVCAALIVVVLAVVLISNYVKSAKKNGKKPDIYEFLSENSDMIISRLQDAVRMLRTTESEYESKEAYEQAIVSITISRIKENCGMLNTKIDIFDYIDEDQLSDVVVAVLNAHKVSVFSVLDIFTINNYPKLYDSEVIEAAAKLENENSEDKNGEEG